MRIVSSNGNHTAYAAASAFGGYNGNRRPPVTSGFANSVPQHRPVQVLTDDMVKAMFARSTVHLNDGVVPVEAEIIGWQRTTAGCLGAIVLNRLTGARFLFGPDLGRGSAVPKLLARLT